MLLSMEKGFCNHILFWILAVHGGFFFIKIRQEFLTSENIVGCFLMHDLEGL